MANENKPKPDEKRPSSGQGAGQKPGQEKKPETDKKSGDRDKPGSQTTR
tara:strand:- start:115 stop:261 length:147 start_codon:yes stop_codon:yes gene_type:complete